MAEWSDLDNELNIWRDSGHEATFWWRDDDAIELTDQLSRLLAIVVKHQAPLGIAVIPSLAKPELRELLNTYSDVSVLQHGFAHIDHTFEGEKSTEFGKARDRTEILCELSTGWAEIEKFDHNQPVFVPPWNRIDEDLYPVLADAGYKVLSVSNFRKTKYISPGLTSINTHVDIINWRGTRGFVGTAEALDDVIEHLSKRRTGHTNAQEPTGLLTHHLVHDDDCWQFMEDLFTVLSGHTAARVINIAEAFAE